MPTAKPRFDGDAPWKFTPLSSNKWAVRISKFQIDLKKLLDPNNKIIACPHWGHPIENLANILFAAASSAIDMEYWLNRRLTNEELRVEIKCFLTDLRKNRKSTRTISHDLVVLIGEPDLNYRNIDQTFTYPLQSALPKVASLPQAKKIKDVQHKAAVGMTIRVLHILADHEIPITATADPYREYFSIAVKILKMLGDALNLCLEETAWKKAIIKARKNHFNN